MIFTLFLCALAAKTLWVSCTQDSFEWMVMPASLLTGIAFLRIIARHSDDIRAALVWVIS